MAQRLFGIEHGLDLDIPSGAVHQKPIAGFFHLRFRDAADVILLDTNVISELLRRVPDPAVMAYVRSLEADAVFTATLCKTELRHGLAQSPARGKRDDPTICLDLTVAAARAYARCPPQRKVGDFIGCDADDKSLASDPLPNQVQATSTAAIFAK